MDKQLKCKLQYHKSPRGEHRRKISDISPSNIFTNTSPRARDIKERINKWDFIKFLGIFKNVIGIIFLVSIADSSLLVYKSETDFTELKQIIQKFT